MAELSDRELLDALGVENTTEQPTTYSVREERIIAGFEDIQRFVAEQGRLPQQGAERDIFERLYAVRLERLRALEDGTTLLAPLDHQGLLSAPATGAEEDFDDAALLAELGVDAEVSGLTELRHVRSTAEKRVAEDIANRTPCEDFAQFKPLFEQVQQDLDTGLRTARPFGNQAEIEPGRYFILGGQKAYVAAMGEEFKQDYGDHDARLRVIFDNGTESNLLRRSLQRALTKDPAGRRITDPDHGPLFAQVKDADDRDSGTIYVLRSLSDHPTIAANRTLIHKIGVTSLEVERRIAGAKLDPTFLMAEVEIVATFALYNINRAKLEHLIHRIFAPARLEIIINDRFGNPVEPREWFLAPLHVIQKAVAKIQDGTIVEYRYDPNSAKLVRALPQRLSRQT